VPLAFVSVGRGREDTIDLRKAAATSPRKGKPVTTSRRR